MAREAKARAELGKNLDNFTHSLVGLALAEGAFRFREFKGDKPAAPWRPYAFALSWAANNFPDLDFVYASALGGKLGYLLHHRGHTHTLLLGIPQAALIFLVGWWLGRRKKLAWRRSDWAWLAALTFGGTWVHVLLDSFNSYGVHPFWPFNRRWFYGDSLFIVEPLFWVLLAPPLVRAVQGTVWRGLLSAVFLAGILLCWLTPYVSPPMAAGVTALGLLSAFLSWKVPPIPRTAITGALALAVLFSFIAASRYSRGVFEKRFEGVDLHDVILTPMPANPLCWGFITVETNREEFFYRLRRGIFAPFPQLQSPEKCPTMRMNASTLPLKPVTVPEDPNFKWFGEWTSNLQELKDLAARNCQAAGLLKFARAPFWMPLTDKQFIMGDLRYDTDKGLSFSEFIFSRTPASCPPAVPTWREPRADVLNLPAPPSDWRIRTLPNPQN